MRAYFTRWWHAFANVVGTFIEEAALRVVLAWAVLRGKSPMPVEKRWWNRATETPVLIDVYDWTNERHIFSILVWPTLEVPPERAAHAQQERVRTVQQVIAKGASELMWSTRYEVDYGLRWDHERQVWVVTDRFAFDGERLYDYFRGEGAYEYQR
jgi:hypothetical protein